MSSLGQSCDSQEDGTQILLPGLSPLLFFSVELCQPGIQITVIWGQFTVC